MQLDYEAPEGCSSAERFADSVSAKLGFVPWKDGATAHLRVRIREDGGEMVGTLELPDGNSKVVRNADCAQLMPALVAAVSVALDSDVTEEVPNVSPQVEADQETQTSGTIHVRATKPGITVSVITRRAARTAGAVTGAVAWEEVCVAPCSFQARYGLTEVMIGGNVPTARRKLTLASQDAHLIARAGSQGLDLASDVVGMTGMAIMVAGALGTGGSFLEEGTVSWVWPAVFLGGVAGMGLGVGMRTWAKSSLDYDSDPPPASRVARAVSYSGTF